MTTCGHQPAFRRDLCRTCYRKFRDAGLPLGPDGRDTRRVKEAAARLGESSQERLDALASRLTKETRERLRRALDRAGASG